MPKDKSEVHYMRGNGCHCNCCMWHRSATIKVILAVMFVAMIADLVLQVFIGQSAYLYYAMLTFIGVVLMIVFIGWLVSMGCTCKGRHWIHGPDEDAEQVAKLRYAKGEITKKEYSDIIKDISK